MGRLAMAVLLAGCAAGPVRQLTPEEDARVARDCLAGCVIVPAEAWTKILSILKEHEL